ncbi:hypothetical protein GGR02_000369 [Anoxybacillus voinovskiensis]|uniref:Uncharacterized protein n=1 Tax=Anoxybacteroides voinovskiense TaxID=230470 RepID=A0A840DLQ1_9BACL|nr:hypothetical protein AT864_03360 [Anoxybacillus sp. P3H1B]MBB4072623.1 hypothetical protein [Anoxybacillus voinovskiensis]GGJ55738.1 hypothetical protein GCM10008982_01190 [Anoxybacillus voinovskiensis]
MGINIESEYDYKQGKSVSKTKPLLYVNLYVLYCLDKHYNEFENLHKHPLKFLIEGVNKICFK